MSQVDNDLMMVCSHLIKIVGKPTEEHLVGRVRNNSGYDAGDVTWLVHLTRVLAVSRHRLVVVGASQLQRLSFKVGPVERHRLRGFVNTPAQKRTHVKMLHLSILILALLYRGFFWTKSKNSVRHFQKLSSNFFTKTQLIYQNSV